MDYQELLDLVSDYGHGVFTVTMCERLRERSALRSWINRYPDKVTCWRRNTFDINIYSLTKKGMSFFSGQDKLSSAENYYSYLEMVILNAYMLEVGAWQRYVLKPNICLTIRDQRIGLLSPRWGLPKDFIFYDKLVTNHQTKLEYLTTNHRSRSPKLVTQITNAYIPKAITFLGNLDRRKRPTPSPIQ